MRQFQVAAAAVVEVCSLAALHIDYSWEDPVRTDHTFLVVHIVVEAAHFVHIDHKRSVVAVAVAVTVVVVVEVMAVVVVVAAGDGQATVGSLPVGVVLAPWVDDIADVEGEFVAVAAAVQMIGVARDMLMATAELGVVVETDSAAADQLVVVIQELARFVVPLDLAEEAFVVGVVESMWEAVAVEVDVPSLVGRPM